MQQHSHETSVERSVWTSRLNLALAVLAIAGLGINLAPAGEEAKSVKVLVDQAGALEPHADWVACVTFSPDGKTLAAGSYESVKLWDVAEQRELATLKSKTGFIRSLAFSTDGKLLATGGYQAVTLWDVETRAVKLPLAGHRGYVTAVAFAPDGKSLATSSEDESAKVWDVAEGKEKLTLKGHAYPVNSVAFSPDGKLIATAAGDSTRSTKPGEVKLWDALTGELRLTLPEHARLATAVAFSPDGRLLASGSFDETVKLWDAADGKPLLTFSGHSRPVTTVSFSPRGGLVASGSGGRFAGKNEIKLWDPADGSERGVIQELAAPVTSVAFAPDAKLLAAGCHDKVATLWNLAPLLLVQADGAAAQEAKPAAPKELRAGVIGLDTSHVIAFCKAFNDPDVKEDLAHCKVVAAYPKGSPDIESSTKRVPEYTAKVKELGVEIVDSIDELLKRVDVVLLETNDGRPHLEQVLPVLKAGKPVFIDKPIAGTLTDAVAIFDAAKKYNVPVFSSSSLRYSEGAQALRNGKVGDILGCEAYSPCHLEPTHPDFFWYGIHGVETLFTVMGTGCQSVCRAASTADFDVAVGTWNNGRVGTFRGIRAEKGASGYGGTAFGTKGIAPIGPYDGYRPLAVEIVKFFRTGVSPVSVEETLEIYAFMEAADESKRQGGIPVKLETVLEKARAAAKERAAQP